MTALLVFAVTLFAAVLLSELARRSVLSMAVVFLVAAFVSGRGMTGWIQLDARDAIVERLAELALFSIRFSDGMRLNLRELASRWRLPGRALIVGLPLTLVGTALLARDVAGLSWLDALLVGAVLSPTDPVFAAAITSRDEIPSRLRHLLNVESGINDGLALPIVLALIALAGREGLYVSRLSSTDVLFVRWFRHGESDLVKGARREESDETGGGHCGCV